jgi:hypothetical protein
MLLFPIIEFYLIFFTIAFIWINVVTLKQSFVLWLIGVYWCLIGVYWCLLVSIGVYWCLLVSYWCLLVSIDVLLVSIGAYWCLLVSICVYWCLLVSILQSSYRRILTQMTGLCYTLLDAKQTGLFSRKYFFCFNSICATFLKGQNVREYYLRGSVVGQTNIRMLYNI